ncbi:dienelactone hydrolase family protein [Maritimibacter sp. UBA3975]|uniref:dienelactone hydrolase family protein n=1 Tax=Maritimibacter sp. UBA3975 TaxID=1946833 RepID=UPI000C09A822|nr:dienelactone hydrolase family protein [Maritimibacter sp. UBA3975]MAM63173.1 dienelactone hydrolase [Maritimibacter sp.]|tara:strand:- start:30010 stop:30666 length:657 start_codon:yes stop_codon:yes gene_type:complete
MMESLTAADGHQFECWMHPAQGTARGGIVILQEIFGVTDQLKGVAEMYAAEGYDVAIPALFDRQAPGQVISFDDAPKGRDLMLSADPGETMMDTDAAVQALKAKGHKVGVMGFCWGGGLALRAAQTLDVDAAVSFYGTRLTQYLDAPLRAPMQGHFGTHDDHTPREVLDETKAYLPAFEMHLYEAGHAFANDLRPSYVAEAADTAHARTKAFFATHLG